MICPVCQTQNREQANYCKNCGHLLLQACPRCSADLPEGARFCDHCGLQLVDTPGFNWWESAQSLRAPAPGAPVEQSPIPTPPPTRPPEPAFEPDSQPSTPFPPAPAPLQEKRSDAQRSDSPTPTAPSPSPIDTQLQQYIPRELLQKLEAARTRGEMIGERRVVTMLFCDVTGSTAAAEQLDPEDWSEIINGAFEFMIQPVYKYEGIVARLMGDGILAFFGAPIAHEDDAQRAVLAGLDIIEGIKPYYQQVNERYGIDFDLRVGINTGLVVVGAVGSDLRMEYTALGDAINLAARMEQTAEPGTVQIAQDTYKLVRTLFDFEELGGIEVKGKHEPVRAYRVLGRNVFARRGRGIEGLYAEMVGREAEMAALRDILTYLKQGVGRIVCILGEAGLGKSRLISESYQVFPELAGEGSNWYDTSSLSYETNQAYGLFQRLIRRVQGIAYNETPSQVREKLARLVENLPEERRARAGKIIESLFGVENGSGIAQLDGELFKQELFEVIKAWWRASFSIRPTVLVFDDMHWSDAASIELLLKLLPLTEEISLVLICALRSERQAPAWQVKTTADELYIHLYTELTLQPLSEAESNELINRLLAVPELPGSLREAILEKSAGNPFFIEELVRTLIDSGVMVPEQRLVNGDMQRFWRATSDGADFELPDNLQALLAARIDRLEDSTRGTLQAAAVIGRSFYHRVLEAVDEAGNELDKRLGTLVRMDMIREAARLPELEYAFRNPLTQEAVYRTILLKRRRTFHRKVGEAMEALYPDRLEGLYGLLAHHFSLAGERAKACEYYRLAAQRAVTLYAYEDAIRNLEAALALVEPRAASETRLVLLEFLADVYRLLRDWQRAIEHYQAAIEQFNGLPPTDLMVAIRLHRKIVEVVSDLKWSVGLEVLQQANEDRLTSRASLVESLPELLGRPPQTETVHVLVALSTDAWRVQEPPDWEVAQSYAQQAVTLAEELDNPVELSLALGALATVLDGRSLLSEHLKVTVQRLQLCRERYFEDERESIEALRSAGAAYMYVGQYKQAMPFLQEAEQLATRAQVIDQQANAVGLQAQCWFRQDRWDEVLAIEEKWRGLERRYPRQRVGET